MELVTCYQAICHRYSERGTSWKYVIFTQSLEWLREYYDNSVRMVTSGLFIAVSRCLLAGWREIATSVSGQFMFVPNHVEEETTGRMNEMCVTILTATQSGSVFIVYRRKRQNC
jgi:hypothetical protein